MAKDKKVNIAVTNALAYYAWELITSARSIVGQARGVQCDQIGQNFTILATFYATNFHPKQAVSTRGLL